MVVVEALMSDGQTVAPSRAMNLDTFIDSLPNGEEDQSPPATTTTVNRATDGLLYEADLATLLDYPVALGEEGAEGDGWSGMTEVAYKLQPEGSGDASVVTTYAIDTGSQLQLESSRSHFRRYKETVEELTQGKMKLVWDSRSY